MIDAIKHLFLLNNHLRIIKFVLYLTYNKEVLKMYVDLIVVVVLLAIVIFFFRRFSSFVYAMAIIDIFLRILAFIKYNVNVPELKSLIGKYFPESIAAIINNYTSGIINDIFMWIYVIIFAIFLGYITKYFIHKRK